MKSALEGMMKIYHHHGLHFWEELGEYEIKEFDDIDDFNGYFEPSFTDYPAFSCSVAVEYVSPTTGFLIPNQARQIIKV